MITVAFIGAGSTIFANRLLIDILSFPELSDASIRLYDNDSERLRTSEIVANRVARSLGVHPTIQATLDRQAALDGAEYVIALFQVGGYKPATVTDIEIPKRFGLRQTIGDTLGIGGIMRWLRTIPVLTELCRDMERLSPGALLMNYVTPWRWAAGRSIELLRSRPLDCVIQFKTLYVNSLWISACRLMRLIIWQLALTI